MSNEDQTNKQQLSLVWLEQSGISPDDLKPEVLARMLKEAARMFKEALRKAIMTDNLQQIERILAADTSLDVNAAHDSETLLCTSIIHGEDTKIIRLLVEHGADINQPDEQGFTPLMCAALNGNDAAASFLFNQGADFAATDKEGKTAVDYAVDFNQVSTAERLIELDACKRAAAAEAKEAERIAASRAVSATRQAALKNRPRPAL